MSWTETHRYYATLRDIETELDLRRDGQLPWRPEFAAVFDSPRRLLDALRSRWLRLVQAQVDEWDDLDALVAAHPGLHAVVTAPYAPPAAAIPTPQDAVPTARGAYRPVVSVGAA